MKKILNLVKNLSKKEDGGGAVEYGLAVALIAAIIVTAVSYMGGSVKDTFKHVAEEIEDRGLGDPPPAGDPEEDDD